jgi:hypothetical protein
LSIGEPAAPTRSDPAEGAIFREFPELLAAPENSSAGLCVRRNCSI